MDSSVDDHIVYYGNNYLRYKEISCLLDKTKGTTLSANAIRKRLKKQGIHSRRGPTIHTKDEIKTALELLIPDQPASVGYRMMTDMLRQSGFHVRRDTVMHLMRELDPVGVDCRRRRRIKRKVYRSFGPNHVWHIDGYDKLKPYGFPIHGCIDGYSRRIMWLTVGPTNNNPSVIGTNFVRCIEEIGGCPLVLQADPGTENVICGAIQCLLRHNCDDCLAGIHSFRVVRSVFNQRIEAWWSSLRRQKSQWWINFFKDLESFGGFIKGNENHILSTRYCFMPLIQHELDQLKDRWNNHYISQSRGTECPSGRPNVLFSVPEESGGTDCLTVVGNDDITFCFSQCSEPTRSGSREFDIFAEQQLNRLGFQDAQHWTDALKQYFHLIDILP